MDTSILRHGGAEGRSAFAITHWSLVHKAANLKSAESQAALESLCRIYWPPLYGFAQRLGYPVEDAQDLTQAFFEQLLSKHYLAAVDHRKGKFRSFLIKALKHFCSKDWRRAHAQKRGGDVTFISFDEAMEAGTPDPGMTVDEANQVFEQEWATALLNQVLPKLRKRYAKRRKAALYEELMSVMSRRKGETTYAEIAPKHQMTEKAFKQAVANFKKRFQKLVRDEIAKTVSSPAQVEEELLALFGAWN